jgi:hypothetical protein
MPSIKFEIPASARRQLALQILKRWGFLSEESPDSFRIQGPDLLDTVVAVDQALRIAADLEIRRN